MRYWPAGERCPHQVLVLWELLRFDLDTENISAAPFKDDTVTTNENICMTTAKSMNEKTCMSASTMNEKCMNEKTLHEKSNLCMNANLHEREDLAWVPTYKMKRYKLDPESPSTLAVQHDPWLFLGRVEIGRMRATCHRRHKLVGEWTPFADCSAGVAERSAKLQSEDEEAEEEVEERGAGEEEIDDDLDEKTFQPTTVYVSWIVNKLCADDVYHHMQRYGPCTFEDWDVQSLGKKAWNTATIKFTDFQDAQRALSAKHVQIENDDKQMVPAELSWQLSAETSLS